MTGTVMPGRVTGAMLSSGALASDGGTEPIVASPSSVWTTVPCVCRLTLSPASIDGNFESLGKTMLNCPASNEYPAA